MLAKSSLETMAAMLQCDVRGGHVTDDATAPVK